ncbi:hypothetical protein B0A52_03564 [Exophiala mesophila]|uniref:Chromosome segregation in meiosis protein n=1 Tax=Exophiala mesophila TaxID=212818 RepID=A0A438N9D8_EXOME|nr:hypothetical protein B0A52_03564 [Exophiala mesophila]
MAADPITSATVDDLLNYGTSDDEDPFDDKAGARNSRDDKPALSPSQNKRKSGENDGLGLDEEVQIKKKRKPIAKLDEERLLSAPGIPKLRELVRSGKIAKKLKFKGKGHEFSDVARLLNYYQLWLDNLYPRAKFADGLQLIEKVGHSRRMQVMRKEWIDEGKPGYGRDKLMGGIDHEAQDLYAGDQNTTASKTGSTSKDKSNTDSANDSLFIADSSRGPSAPDGDDLPEDDELDALLAESGTYTAPPKPRSPPRRANLDSESEGEDDLDALLAEQETRRPAITTSAPHTNQSVPAPNLFDNPEDDDLDALLAEHEAESRTTHPPISTAANTSRPQVTSQPSQPKPHTRIFEDSDDDEDNDMDDLDALLAEQEARQKPTVPTQSSIPVVAAPLVDDGAENIFSSSPPQKGLSQQMSG